MEKGMGVENPLIKELLEKELNRLIIEVAICNRKIQDYQYTIDKTTKFLNEEQKEKIVMESSINKIKEICGAETSPQSKKI